MVQITQTTQPLKIKRYALVGCEKKDIPKQTSYHPKRTFFLLLFVFAFKKLTCVCIYKALS